MNAKIEKKLRKYGRQHARADMNMLAEGLTQMPWRARLKFAWGVLRGRNPFEKKSVEAVQK